MGPRVTKPVMPLSSAAVVEVVDAGRVVEVEACVVVVVGGTVVEVEEVDGAGSDVVEPGRVLVVAPVEVVVESTVAVVEEDGPVVVLPSGAALPQPGATSESPTRRITPTRTSFAFIKPPSVEDRGFRTPVMSVEFQATEARSPALPRGSL